MEWWFFLGLLVIAVVAAWRRRVRLGRQRQLMLLCMHAGLHFSVMDPFPEHTWLPFRLFGKGPRRGIENVIWDRRDPHGEARAFDYWYEERQGQDSKVLRRLTCAVVRLPLTCPRLEVAPRDVVSDALEQVTGEDVTLELEAFNRRFRVRSDDRRFAVAFCDQRMMQALMTLPMGVSVTVNEDRMLLRADDLLEPGQVLLLLEAARALVGRVPRVVTGLYPPRSTKSWHEDRWLQGRWSPDPIGSEARPDRHPAVG